MVHRNFSRSFFVFLLAILCVSSAGAVDTLQVTSPDPVLEKWRWTEFDQSSGLAGGVHDIFEDQDGNIWFATNQGAQRYDGYRWMTYTTEDGLVDNCVRTIHQTRDGAMWFGTHDGISRFDGETWTTYTTADRVTVKAKMEDGQLELSVSDTGKGIFHRTSW